MLYRLLRSSPSANPNLLYHKRYVHADGVQHPRPLHQSWNGITLPHDAPIWSSHFCTERLRLSFAGSQQYPSRIIRLPRASTRSAVAADYELVWPVLLEADTIKLGDKSYQGSDRVVVMKTIGRETYRCVFEVRPGKRNRSLSLISLVIKTD